MWNRGLTSSFACEYSVLWHQHHWLKRLFFLPLSFSDTLSNARVYFWIDHKCKCLLLDSHPLLLISRSILMPLPHCLKLLGSASLSTLFFFLKVIWLFWLSSISLWILGLVCIFFFLSLVFLQKVFLGTGGMWRSTTIYGKSRRCWHWLVQSCVWFVNHFTFIISFSFLGRQWAG